MQPDPSPEGKRFTDPLSEALIPVIAKFSCAIAARRPLLQEDFAMTWMYHADLNPGQHG